MAINAYIEKNFHYDSRTCDEIRPGYRSVESCQETVPEEQKSQCRNRLPEKLLKVLDRLDAHLLA